MTPELKDIYGIDFHQELEQWKPADPLVFSAALEMTIGITGEEACDVFSVLVVTPDFLRHRVSGVLQDRGTLIVSRWDGADIRRHIAQLVGGCSGGHWLEVSSKLRGHSCREYDEMS